MRPELELLLRSRFPVLYRYGAGRRDGGAKQFSPNLGDGRFAILTAVSDVLERHMDEAGLDQFQILRIAPQRGGMHFYCSGGDRFAQGATDAASHMSLALSEQTGRPGRLMFNERGDYCTVAPGELDGCEPVSARAMRPDRPPVGAGGRRALTLLGQRWGHIVSQDIDVPAGWTDVVDVLLTAFANAPHLVGCVRAWHGGAVGQLVVAWDTGHSSPYQDGVVAFAVSMAALIDPATGACGPVDDNGSPEWWRRLEGGHGTVPVLWGGYDGDGAWRSRVDSIPGPAPGHPSGSLIVADHREAGDMQISLKPTVAQAMRKAACQRGVSSCAALMAELLEMPSTKHFIVRSEGLDGNGDAGTGETIGTGAETLSAIHLLASAAHAQLAMAADAARGTAVGAAIQAACLAVGALLDSTGAELGTSTDRHRSASPMTIWRHPDS
ncbi:hypothetical protein [Belnapia rosea]|uniref:hypothetical protein n=1 Tax=Belnapia rosea TaxID=938405 RepID=UPI0008882E0B|nr:hypothetical protein [Belnapia rosea]SDB22533.1 hypothetical protein SAMN02927895_00901 [Belnapia rosea]